MCIRDRYTRSDTSLGFINNNLGARAGYENGFKSRLTLINISVQYIMLVNLVMCKHKSIIVLTLASI